MITFLPVFQPIKNVSDGSSLCAEVLSRWKTPDGRLHAPGQLNLNRIDWRKIDRGVINYLLSHKKDIVKKIDHIFINVSAQTLLDNAHFFQWVDSIKELIEDGSLKVTIEITEQVPDDLLERRWCDIAIESITMAIDDFGVCNSTFSRLKSFPWLYCKVEVAGIESLISDNAARIFIDAGIKLIAEKVETLDQANFASNRNISLQQGYIHYKPLPIQSLMLDVKESTYAY
ncbi:EAL domain-containing protein [Comamonas sp. C11]|uniref:EAL domain-containing protein n=1 Tax=Comamonas sp. C11 TaxID=2966554 RepID=UPI00211363DF|nr:EAL domain-containing protein [Comamonas sp. C11]UUC96389.1 EAL domain-containing protein [Comamonas sp. C11]